MLKSNSLFIIFFSLVLCAFCALDTKAQETGKNPVIIIPGIQGSELVNPKTGKTVWFSLRRDVDDDLRLPMTSANLARNRDNLIAKDIIREIKTPRFIPNIEVYQGVIDALKARGYQEANWDNPQTTDVFYVFPYDWRRDNVETARILIQRMEAVKRSVKRPDLKFDILAHSMGGLVARYAAMYGAADLPITRGKINPTWAGAKHINKLLMFGVPNEGSFGAFEALINGYPIVAERNLPFVDDFSAEDVLSSPALFQLMPNHRSARFLDENLQPLKVDLYDPQTWRKYNWGAVNDPKFLSKLKDAERLARGNKAIKPSKPKEDANFDDRLVSQTTSAQVRAYFAAVLDRARRFHSALGAQTENSPIEIYIYGGNCEQTLNAVVIMRDEKKDGWVTLTAARDIKTGSGAEIKKEVVREAMFALGDGRVTQRSLIAAGAASEGGTDDSVKALLPMKSSVFTCGLHTKLFLEKQIQDSFLSALVVEKTAQP